MSFNSILESGEAWRIGGSTNNWSIIGPIKVEGRKGMNRIKLEGRTVGVLATGLYPNKEDAEDALNQIRLQEIRWTKKEITRLQKLVEKLESGLGGCNA